jgi:hypothetical protein
VKRVRGLGPAVLALAFGLLAAWSWGRWADVQTFGGELYGAWRLSEGAALYRDLAHRGGPLSPHVNALWFTLFGVSVRTLFLCNLAVLGAISALLWRIVAPACGRLAATLAGLVFLGIFGFAQYRDDGSHNYVAPHQHGQTHGLVLSLAMIALFASRLRRPRASADWLAGACAGGVLLTQAELAVPAAATALAGLAALRAAAPAAERPRGRALLRFAAGAALPVAGFAGALLARMPAAVALRGLLGGGADPGAGPVPIPLDALAADLWRAVRIASGMGLFAALAYAVDRSLSRRRSGVRWGWAAGIALFLVLLLSGVRVPWTQIGRALPFTTLVACGLLVGIAWNARGETERFARIAPLALFSILALGLLAGLGLRPRIAHEGFVLAMPATLLLALGFFHGLPRLRRESASRGALLRGFGTGAVAAGVVFHLAWSNGVYAHKNFAVGEGADAILAEDPSFDPRATRLARALAWMGERLPPGATLVALPEGLSLNYWLRRANPTRHGGFLPVEIRAAGGEAALLAELRAHPPDWVALVDRVSHASVPFGSDPASGETLLRWVESHYRRELRVGPEPFRGQGFGILVLRRSRGVSQAHEGADERLL